MKTPKTTPTPNAERLRQLKQLFPECLTEGEVDPEKLQKLLYTSGGGVKHPNDTPSRGQGSAMPSVSSIRPPRRR